MAAKKNPSGTTVTTAGAGVATFRGLGVDLVGGGYVLEADGGGFQGSSAPFSLTAPSRLPPSNQCTTPISPRQPAT